MTKRNLSQTQKKYFNFFLDTLQSYNVDTPADLDDDAKFKFFDELKNGWKYEKNENTDVNVQNENKNSKENIKKVVEELVRKKIKSINKHK
jgi:hypothetical protein